MTWPRSHRRSVVQLRVELSPAESHFRALSADHPPSSHWVCRLLYGFHHVGDDMGFNQICAGILYATAACFLFICTCFDPQWILGCSQTPGFWLPHLSVWFVTLKGRGGRQMLYQRCKQSWDPEFVIRGDKVLGDEKLAGYRHLEKKFPTHLNDLGLVYTRQFYQLHCVYQAFAALCTSCPKKMPCWGRTVSLDLQQLPREPTQD